MHTYTHTLARKRRTKTPSLCHESAHYKMVMADNFPYLSWAHPLKREAKGGSCYIQRRFFLNEAGLVSRSVGESSMGGFCLRTTTTTPFRLSQTGACALRCGRACDRLLKAWSPFKAFPRSHTKKTSRANSLSSSSGSRQG